jgi:hypothetical protein
MAVRRVGTHRLECQMCDGHGYFTIVQLETRGLPACGWCALERPDYGALLYPAKVDLALELGVDHPSFADIAIDGYHREMAQTRKLGGCHNASLRYAGITGDVPKDMHERALDVHRQREREAVKARLRSNFTARIPAEPIPF